MQASESHMRTLSGTLVLRGHLPQTKAPSHTWFQTFRLGCGEEPGVIPADVAFTRVREVQMRKTWKRPECSQHSPPNIAFKPVRRSKSGLSTCRTPCPSAGPLIATNQGMASASPDLDSDHFDVGRLLIVLRTASPVQKKPQA